MLKIYGVYRSRATRPIWLCDEMGVAFDHVPVVQGYRLSDPLAPDAPMSTQSPTFLAINPTGKVPAIEDDGLVMNESLAINLYIARKHGGPIAGQSIAEEGELMMWTAWALTEFEPLTVQIMYHRVMKPEAERDPAIADAAIAALAKPFAVLNAALAKTGFLVGGRFTVADINVAECARYAQAAPELFAAAPHVKAWLDACQSRPAFVAMMAKRNAEPA